MLFKKILKNRPIRFKFTFIFVLFLLAILCLFSFLVYVLLSYHIQHNIKNSLLFSIEQSIHHFFDRNGDFHLHKPQNPRDEISQFIFIQIYDQKQLLYTSYDLPPIMKWGIEEIPLLEFKEIEQSKYLMYAMPFSSHSKRYTIQAFYLQTEAKEELQNLIAILIFLMLACGVFACFGSWYISGKLLFPFRQIAENASRIRAENLEEKLYYPVERDEIGQLCVTLNDLFYRLKESFESLKRFTSDVSHELKTPLTIIQGEIEVLLRKTRTPEDYEEALLGTLKEIERMNSLIQSLLLLAQAEGLKSLIETERVFLSETIKIAKYNAKKICAEFDSFSIEEEISPDLAVEGNPIWIQQILENLLNNAFQNTPKGGSVKIKATRNKNEAHVSIENTGDGISSEHLPFIFNRFYRIHPKSSQHKRFGLGLAICKILVELHKGQIQVSSVPGKTTVFTVSFPLCTPIQK